MFSGRSKLRGQARKPPSLPSRPAPNRRPSRSSLFGNPLNNRPVVEDEETFSLVSLGRESRAFAVSVKLVPGLVEELKKVEALGGSPPRIKFSASGTNPSENVIDVGGKRFKFTWSTEFAELCDIYEEQQSGRDGNHSLVESGSCCRKVNVQRILDESTTNHVKMLSEEAERKQKSRKAIVLDHGNPSIKSQTKQMAAAEINQRKSFHHNKGSSFKKQKVEAQQGPKSLKSRSAPTSVKGRISSPLASPAIQIGIPASTHGTGSISKRQLSTEGVRLAQINVKENATNSEKEISASTSPALRDGPEGCKEKTTGYKGNVSIKPLDLESMLFTILKENPKGMTLETLQKAVGGTFPKSSTELEPVLEKFATFQGGRYFLKPRSGLDSDKKFMSDNRRCDHAADIRVEEKNLIARSADQAHSKSKFVEELNALGKDDIQHQSSNLFVDKVFDINEGQSHGTGSEVGSKSESSESESDSGSRSRSNSTGPVGSGSESSSHSESDASSNSKEGSDEDVDIGTIDEEKEPQQNLQVSDPGYLGSPALKSSGLDATDENQDVDAFTAVGIEGQIYNAMEITGHELPYNSQTISRRESKRGQDLHWNEKHEHAKRAKTESLVTDHGNRYVKLSESPFNCQVQDNYKGPAIQVIRSEREANADFGFRVCNQETTRKPNPESQQSGQRSSGQSKLSEAPDTAGEPKCVEISEQDCKCSGQGSHVHKSFPVQKGKVFSGKQHASNVAMVGDRNLAPFDINYTKRGEILGKSNDVEVSNSCAESSPKDGSTGIDKIPVSSRKTLQRELSDLEQGEKNDKSLPQPNRQADQSQRHVSGGDNADVGSLVNKLAEAGSRLKWCDVGTKLGNDTEGQGEGHRKGVVSVQPVCDIKCGLLSHSAKESKTQPSNKIDNLVGAQKDVLLEDNCSAQICREPFLEEDGSFFKYEKGVPDLKGPIRDFNQYKTYVQEYREKYDSYCNLDKILENYRSEFHKMAVDLEYAKGRNMEMYHKILVQLKESYCRHAPNHIRSKKVFIVLHEELKNLKQRIKEFALQYSRG